MELDNNLEPETKVLSDSEILKKIWFSPRQVFKYINDYKYGEYVSILLVMGGITTGFNAAISGHWGNGFSPSTVIILSFVVGGIYWIGYYISAALISWTGEWLNGKGNSKSIIRVIAYSLLPSLITLLLFIPELGLFGNKIFQSNIDLANSGFWSRFVFYIIDFLRVILPLWSFILMIIGISEVQKLTIWKSILNIILPSLVIVVPMMIIILLFKMG